MIIGNDNVPRGAKILQGNGRTIERPLQKIVPLEIMSNSEDNAKKSAEIPSADSVRPRRTAAVIADERRKLIDQYQA